MLEDFQLFLFLWARSTSCSHQILCWQKYNPMFIFQCQRHRCSTFIHGGHYVFTQCICSRSLPTGFGRFSMEYLALDATRCRHNIATWWSNLDLVDPQQGYLISLYLNPHLLVNCWKLIIILWSFISGNMMIWGMQVMMNWLNLIFERKSFILCGEVESLGWVVRRLENP